MVVVHADLGLDEPPGDVQGRRPHPVEEASELDEPGRAGPVEPPGAVFPFVEQSRPLEHGEVLGDRRPSHFEVGGDLAGRDLLGRDELEDGAPAGFGQGAERVSTLVTPSVTPTTRPCGRRDR